MLQAYLLQGGPMMWPLLGCSVGLGAVLFERSVALGWQRLVAPPGSARERRRRLRGQRRGKRGGSGLATTSVPQRPGPQRSVHPFFWEVPPQLGLLGTVIGLVQIFQGNLSSEAFGAGVGVACLTTIFGISIAVVARTSSHALNALAGQPPAPDGGAA